MPAGVAGTGPSSCSTSLPRLTGCNPSPSLAGSPPTRIVPRPTVVPRSPRARTRLSTSASTASATGAPASSCAVIDAILPPGGCRSRGTVFRGGQGEAWVPDPVPMTSASGWRNPLPRAPSPAITVARRVDAGRGASVEEMALAREDHGQAELVGAGDDVLVTRRAGGPSGLDDHRDAGGLRRLDAVGEGIEGVAGAGAARRPARRLRRRQLARLDPVLL